MAPHSRAWRRRVGELRSSLARRQGSVSRCKPCAAPTGADEPWSPVVRKPASIMSGVCCKQLQRWVATRHRQISPARVAPGSSRARESMGSIANALWVRRSTRHRGAASKGTCFSRPPSFEPHSASAGWGSIHPGKSAPLEVGLNAENSTAVASHRRQHAVAAAV